MSASGRSADIAVPCGETLAAPSPPLCPARHPPQSVAACLSIAPRRIFSRMGTKSRETIYGASVRAAAERATKARKEADRLAVEAWNKRMLGFQGPAQPSPRLGDALNAGYRYLEVKCLGCNTHQTVALDIVRRPKATPIHELERYMRCRQCSEVRRYPYKRSHLVALRPTKISASDPPSTWWPGER
jgi:RNase P subunit RPR2